MKTKFYVPNLSDKRIQFACEYLEGFGYRQVENVDNADFVLLGIGSNDDYGVLKVDYSKNECFQIENAYLTAESAIAIATESSDCSLLGSSILIVGYGRIGKALHKLLGAYTTDITVCARSGEARSLANMNGAKTIDFSALKNANPYKFIFNTVPHPVFNDDELKAVHSDAILIDLASFPGGVDKHIARSRNVRLIEARGLPGKCSPKSAGKIVANTINTMLKEEEI